MTHNRDPRKQVRQGDPLAWTVSFVVTLGLHIGIVLFAMLVIALILYSLASAFAHTSWGVRAITWSGLVISLTIFGSLVKHQVRGFRPHTIDGLGQVVIVTSGCEWGEIAADSGTVLFGMAQIGPLLVSLLTRGPAPDRMQIATALLGGLLISAGSGSLAMRLWLRRRRAQGTGSEQMP